MPRLRIRTHGFTLKFNSQESRLCFLGHALMEKRNGLVVDAVSLRPPARSSARRHLVLNRRPGRDRITLGADKLFSVQTFVVDLRQRQVKLHIASNRMVSKTGGYAPPPSTAAPHVTPATPRDQRFVVNRLQSALLGEAFRLVWEGIVDADEVNLAVSDGLALRWCFLGAHPSGRSSAPSGREWTVFSG